MQRYLTALFSAVVIGFLPCFAKDDMPPKVVAPDLTVTSVEYGKFLDDPASPLRFQPTAVVPGVGKRKGLYGWRMKLRTTRKAVTIRADGSPVRLSKSRTHQSKPKDENSLARSGLEFLQAPVDGYVYHATDFVTGVSPGKYKLDLYIDGRKVASPTYSVE
jgi:hypothetical protein